MFITFHCINLPKPDYSKLYAETIEEYNDFIQQAANEAEPAYRRSYYSSACMRLLKTSNLVSFITQLLATQQIKPEDLEPQILQACELLWTKKALFHELNTMDFDWQTALELSGQTVTDTYDSIIKFGTKEPPAPPAFTTFKSSSVLLANKNITELRDYFVSFESYCKVRGLVVGSSDQVYLMTHWIPEDVITPQSLVEEYLKIGDNPQQRPQLNEMLRNRQFEGWESEFERYKKAAKKRPVGRPKKVIPPEQQAKLDRYTKIKEQYNEYLNLLSELKIKHKKEKDELVQEFEKCKEELSAAKRDM